LRFRKQPAAACRIAGREARLTRLLVEALDALATRRAT
jgi:hypothetical protein